MNELGFSDVKIITFEERDKNKKLLHEELISMYVDGKPLYDATDKYGRLSQSYKCQFNQSGYIIQKYGTYDNRHGVVNFGYDTKDPSLSSIKLINLHFIEKYSHTICMRNSRLIP